MVNERTHTQKELIRQKELDKTFIRNYGFLSDGGKRRFKGSYDIIIKRVKDDYKDWMLEVFFDSGVSL